MHTFLKNKGVVIILLVLIWSCTNRKSETIVRDNQPKFDTPLKVIESHFDSLTIVYENAIDYLAKNPGDSLSVRNRFQSEAAHHFNLIVETMESVNRQYENKDISVDLYDNYVSSLKKLSAGFKEKKAELAKYGFEFKLHNPYISKDPAK
jgi:hypothetical protein